MDGRLGRFFGIQSHAIMSESHRFGRQRLAWTVLIVSFFSCILMSLTIPLAVTTYLQNATRALEVNVQANQGTVGIDEASGQRRAVLVDEPAQSLNGQATIRTDTTASALAEIAVPGSATPLARMQISGNSTVRIDDVTMPRFATGRQVDKMKLQLGGGRIRLDIPVGAVRPFVVSVVTPQGTVDIREPGRYLLEVHGDTTQITVQEFGQAQVTGQDHTIALQSGERAEIAAGQPPDGPLSPSRDLLHNGDFSNGFDNWAVFAWQVELPDQPKGETSIQNQGGDAVLNFTRQGIGHADAKVTQSLNQDVSGYDSVQLSATLRILEQSLGVCGVQGSECPLFFVVNYIDESGVNRVWQHGFFAQGTVDDNLTPGACISCAVVQTAHDRIPLGATYFYDVDLIQELASQGFLPPRNIESVSIVASGHSFTSEVSDISLIVD